MNDIISNPIIISAVVFLTAAVLLFILRKVFTAALRRWATSTETTADDLLLKAIRYPSLFWVFAIALYLALATSEVPEPYMAYALKILYVTIILSVTVAVANITSGFVQRHLEGSAKDAPVTGLSRGIIKGVILVLGFLVILNSLGISITPLITALGVGGLAVALALQETLSNLFAGVHILIERPLKVGDYIELGSGEKGYVMDIGWRTTKIRKIGNNIVIIPNAKLAQSTITNYFMNEKRMSLLIPVGVSYDSDPEVVEEVLLDVAKSASGDIKGLLKEPPPIVRFSPGFGDSSLDFTLICQIGEFVDQYFVQSELRKRIFKRFKADGIGIPFPIRTVYLKKD